VGSRTLVRQGLLASIVVAVIMGLGQATAAADVVDAQCPSGFPKVSFTEPTGAREAQTFTVGTTGNLTQAQVEINKTGHGSLQLQLLATDGAGTPVNTVLGVAFIDDASVPLGVTDAVGIFAPAGRAVQAGQRLALVVTSPSSPPLGATFDVLFRPNDPCPGSAFHSPTPGPDPFTPSGPGYDLIFQTMVNPSNAFTIGKLNGKTLNLTVPGKGVIAVADATATSSSSAISAKAKKLLKPVQAAASGPGAVAIILRLTKRAKGLLRQKGKLTAKAAVTFTPTGGSPKTQRRDLTFKFKKR
jgi:hypothetical protein